MTRLQELGIKSLKDLYEIQEIETQKLLGLDAERWLVACHTLPLDQQGLPELKKRILKGFPNLQTDAPSWQENWKWCMYTAIIFLQSFCFNPNSVCHTNMVLLQTVKELAAILLIFWGLCRVAVIFGWIPGLCPNAVTNRVTFDLIHSDIRQFFLDWLSGNRALARTAQVFFHWEEPVLVGNTVSFTIQVRKYVVIYDWASK